jgi:hypothetical protein
LRTLAARTKDLRTLIVASWAGVPTIAAADATGWFAPVSIDPASDHRPMIAMMIAEHDPLQSSTALRRPMQSISGKTSCDALQRNVFLAAPTEGASDVIMHVLERRSNPLPPNGGR